MALERTNRGLVAREGEYRPLRAFSQGGYYWDKQPQGLILDSGLKEFLPPVEREADERGKYGRFHLERRTRELLSGSIPLGRRSVPPDQLRGLKLALAQFKGKAKEQATQPNNRELIERFRLPDASRDPDLYRLIGPWWKRRLLVLWGCEGTENSSLPAMAALEKLEEDRLCGLKRALAALLLLALLLAAVWAIWSLAPRVRSKLARWLNKPPVAALVMDRHDVTNRSVTVSDGGSVDPDGEIRRWLVSWGDGRTTNLANRPTGLSQTYARGGEYAIELLCVDNLGMTSREPSTVRVVFDYEKRLLAEAEAQKRKADVERAAAEAKKAEHDRDLAQAEADKRQADVERAKKEADQAREAAEQAKAQAEKALKEKGVADEAVKQAQKDAEDALKKAKEAEETKKQAEKDTEDALKKAKEADEIKKRAEEEAKGAQEPNKPRPKNQELQAPGVVRPKTPSENRPEKGDVKIGRPVIVPGFTLKTTPRYPVESLRRKERGTVVLDISFDAQGVLEVRIRESSGYRALDEAAKQHVEREATLQKGYAGRLLLPIEFRIR